MTQDFDVNNNDVASAVTVAKELTSERDPQQDTIFDTSDAQDLFNQVLRNE